MKYFILLLSIIVFSLLFSCEDEKITNPKPDAVSPHITSIEPDSAYIGDIVTIIGTGFGTTHDTSKVSFTGADATAYTSWDSTEIKVKVPSGAESGKVSVTVNGTKSNEVDFWVQTNPFIKDTVKICDQVWMTKNLDVDHYRNGDSIPEVRDPKVWQNLKTGAWCYYNNDPELGKIYGKLYNWYTVNDPRGLAPDGWHIPTDAEWKELEICLGMSPSVANEINFRGTDQGSQLSGRAELWLSGRLTNDPKFGTSGFSALPCGGYGVPLGFYPSGQYCFWWTATEYNSGASWLRHILSIFSNTSRHYSIKQLGFSVRCVRD